ncbi:MAG: Nmad5 family putative nucleotide modification protein [Candidatus Paceibacterota bacterium]|jgi:hypothetical protein
MRLTKTDKEAFVHAVMQDVPEVDYKDQARKKAHAALDAQLPKEVQAFVKKCPGWLNEDFTHLPGNLGVVCAVRPLGGFRPYHIRDTMPELWEELKVLADVDTAQSSRRAALKSSVMGVINACNTLKQAKERLPEFEKYLPADRDGNVTAGLPVANVVADLVKLGWPKSANETVEA